MAERVAIFLDGGFVKKKLQQLLRRFPEPADLETLASCIMGHPRLRDGSIYRVFYYDAPPLEGSSTNPLDNAEIDFSATQQAKQNRSLIDGIELLPDFAVRRGQLMQTGWKLGNRALRSLKKKARALEGRDLVPDITQKGVDIRIGLDLASVAIGRLTSSLVLVSGDSDFVPAMKLARKEGLKVYLETLGHGVRRELKVHADLVLASDLSSFISSVGTSGKEQ